MRKKKNVPDPEAWTTRDGALWKTAELASAVLKRKLEEEPTFPVPFALRFGGASEGVYAHGPFQLFEVRAGGDGSYVQNSSVVAATGRGAVPFMLGFVATQAIGNAARRNHANNQAHLQLQTIDHGTVGISNYGFYLHTPAAVHAWQWRDVTLAELTGPGQLRIQGQSNRGSVNWILESDWAELIFVFWASVCNPTHQQFVTRTWLPQEWVTRAFIWSKSHSSATSAGFKDLYDGLES